MERPSEKIVEARCGLQVVNLVTGDAVHWAKIEGIGEELSDVVVLQTARRPAVLEFKTDEVRQTLIVGELVNI